MKHKERKFQCLLCSKKFGSKQNLEQHEVIHTGLASFHCSVCALSFKRQHHFKSHLNSQAHRNKAVVRLPKRIAPLILEEPLEEEELKCEPCGMTFKFEGHLRQHLKAKAHLSKVDKLEQVREQQDDFSLVIPLNFDTEQPLVDEELINLADSSSFLDDNNVQLIIVNDAHKDVMLMTSEVKLSDAASEDHNL
jgi:uncharacterized C2H2 Zn-finger protein